MNDMYWRNRRPRDAPEIYFNESMYAISTSPFPVPQLCSFHIWTVMNKMPCAENVPPSSKAEGGTSRRYSESLNMVSYTFL